MRVDEILLLRLNSAVRDRRANYKQTMSVLEHVAKGNDERLRQGDNEIVTKSSIMVGLGERMEEVKETIAELRSWGVNILTVGQYLQPSRRHLPIERYYTLEEFAEIKSYARETVGFEWVECAPLVRSSYRAGQQVRVLGRRST